MSEPHWMLIKDLPADFLLTKEGKAGQVITVLDVSPKPQWGLTNGQILDAWIRNKVVAPIPAVNLEADHIPFPYQLPDLTDDVEAVSPEEQDRGSGKTPEMVDHPNHYNQGKFECIEVAEELGFLDCALIFSAFRYIWRHRDKNKPKQDIKKAIWYLQRKLDTMPEDPE